MQELFEGANDLVAPTGLENLQDTNDRPYDIIDSDGNLVEKAEAVTPAIPPPLSKSELGRLRKQHVTIQLPRVTGCGHRIDISRLPRHRNCHNCWIVFFQNNSSTTEETDTLYRAGNSKFITDLQGTKYLKRFLGFMSLVANLQKQGLVAGNDGAQV